MGNGDISYDILRLVRVLYQASVRAVNAELAGSALTMAMRAVLEALSESGPLTVPSLAREFNVTRQGVQVLVDELDRLGLTEFQTNPAHKRSHLVVLTPEGRSAFLEIHSRELAALDQRTGAFDPAELRHTAEVLVQLAQAIGADVSATPPTEGDQHEQN